MKCEVTSFRVIIPKEALRYVPRAENRAPFTLFRINDH